MNWENAGFPEWEGTTVSAARVAAADAGLLPGPQGVPGRVLHFLDLDRWHAAGDTEIVRCATVVRGMLPMVVGVARRTPPPRLAPLLDALTLTLAGPDVVAERPELVPVAHVGEAYDQLEEAVGHRLGAGPGPRHPLRETGRPGTGGGLAGGGGR